MLGFLLRVSDEVCENVSGVLGSLNNLVYYCETNNCVSRIKQLLFAYFEGEPDTSELFETRVVSVIKETVPACSNDSYNDLKS